MAAPVWQARDVVGLNPTTSRTCSVPSGTVSNDLLLMKVVWTDDPGALTGPTPDAWTLEDSSIASGQVCTAIYSRIASGAEGNQTLSWVNSVGCALSIHRYTGNRTTTPVVKKVKATSGSGTGTSATAPTITGLDGTNVLLVMLVGALANGTTVTPDAAMTERMESAVTGGPTQEVATEATNVTSTGTRTATLSGATRWTVQMVAIHGTETPPTTADLTVVVTGNGHVTSADGGIDCPADCSETYPIDTEVVLTPIADPGWSFDHWTGDGTGDTLRTVEMDADHSVTAVFVEVPDPHAPTSHLSFLGCGDWTVRINHKGGTPIVEIPVVSFSCNRTLDDMSQGSAKVAVSDVPDWCRAPLSDLRAWGYELELARDGKTAWVGPLAGSITYTRNDANLPARDLFQWFERRTLPTSSGRRDVCWWFEQYGLQAEAPDPVGIEYDREDAGLQVQRTVNGADYVLASDALRELADVGVDFTMIGRTLRIRGANAGDLVGLLLDHHILDDATVTDDGLQVASEIVVLGNAPSGSDVPVSGVAGGVDPEIGLVVRTITDTAIDETDDAQSAAAVQLAVAGTAPRQLTCTLTPEAAVGFKDLIPGDFIAVSAQVGLILVDEVLMISDVAMSGPPEKITLTLIRTEGPPLLIFAPHNPET